MNNRIQQMSSGRETQRCKTADSPRRDGARIPVRPSRRFEVVNASYRELAVPVVRRVGGWAPQEVA